MEKKCTQQRGKEIAHPRTYVCFAEGVGWVDLKATMHHISVTKSCTQIGICFPQMRHLTVCACGGYSVCLWGGG